MFDAILVALLVSKDESQRHTVPNNLIPFMPLEYTVPSPESGQELEGSKETKWLGV